MCGIAGILRRRHLSAADPSRLLAMTGALVHRGPDDFGLLLLDSRDGRFQLGQAGLAPMPCDLCLGNRRLAILDLSPNGRQPLHNETGDLFVVHNGEIYNYLELRRILEPKGHVFRSQTDTEVIVHAYEEWGSECVQRFNGMWAFALWDQRRRELFCSRDRFGVKPFYYYLDDEVFLFASEIKAILQAIDSPPEPDQGAVADYLLAGAVCHNRDTFFAGIKRLLPSHNLVVSARGHRETRYWDYGTESHAYDRERPVETFRELLHDAVRLRLRSDVPLGVALSGGVDSTTILASAARLLGGRPPKTFAAVFPGEHFDEQVYAQLAARHFDAELYTVDYRPEHLVEDLRSLLWHLDYPSPQPQILPRWSLMRLISRHVRVVLEGQGADEMLAGYLRRYLPPYLRDRFSGLGLGSFGTALAGLPASLPALWRGHEWSTYAWVLRHQLARVTPPRHRALAPEFLAMARGRQLEPAPASPFPDRLTSMLAHDHASAMLPMLLKLGDAISMAHSLESRLPFLDYRLVELVFGLPSHHKLDLERSKGVLRSAMAGAIPEPIRTRRDKVGFVTPITRWIGERLDSDVRPVLLSERARSRGIFDMRRLEGLLAAGPRRGPSWGMNVFRWLSLELWFRLFIDGEGRPEPAPTAAPSAAPVASASG